MLCRLYEVFSIGSSFVKVGGAFAIEITSTRVLSSNL